MVALDVIAMAITASRKIQGPRVTDLNGTVADYGTPLNYVYGTRRIEAACFYCEPVKEKKDTSKTKGGTYVEYLYYGTFAVIACDHKLDRFSRIWLDRHLVYDITGSGEEIQQPEDGSTLSQFMRQYLGDPDQSPDPRMVAYITHKEGAGRTPAYLDISYLMFEQLPLQFLGNHFPQASVEVDGGGGPVQVFTTTPFTLQVTGSGGGGVSGNGNFRFHMIPTSYVIFSFDCIAHDNLGNTDEIGASIKMLDETVPIYDFAFAPPSDTIVYQTLVGEVYVTIPRDDTRTKDGGYTVIVESERPLTIDAFDSLNGSFVNFGWAITTLGPDNPDHFLNDIPRDWDPLPTLNGAPLSGYQYYEHEFSPRGTEQIQAALTVSIFPPEEAVPVTLGFICGDVVKRCGLLAADFDFSGLDQLITGFSWTIADAKQIVGPLLDLYDSDIFMHNFQLFGRKRGDEVDDGDQIETEFLIRERGSNANSASAPLYQITDESESDLPRRIFLTYADTTGGQQPNTAVSQRNVASTVTVREVPVDLTNLALDPDEAQPLAERWLRREWMGGLGYQFITGPDEMAMECADLRTANLGGELLRGRLTRMTLRADRSIKTEWQVDGPAALPVGCTMVETFKFSLLPGRVPYPDAQSDGPWVQDGYYGPYGAQVEVWLHQPDDPSKIWLWTHSVGTDKSRPRAQYIVDSGTDPTTEFDNVFVENDDVMTSVVSGDDIIVSICDQYAPFFTTNSGSPEPVNTTYLYLYSEGTGAWALATGDYQVATAFNSPDGGLNWVEMDNLTDDVQNSPISGQADLVRTITVSVV